MSAASAGRPAEAARVEVALFRPFFLAGILTVLTTGCLLGAVALLGIARRGGYTAGGWTPYLLAHANAQLYGWIGFFVVGFALQQHPPSQARAALYFRLAGITFALLAAAIPLRFAAEALGNLPLGVVASCFQALAVLLFGVNSGLTRHRPRDPATGASASLPWQSRFIFASLFWWTVVALAEPWAFLGSHAPNRWESVAFIAQWFAPLREAQFLGFVPQMVFGVALSRLPADFGLPPARRAPGQGGFVLWNVALLLRLVGWQRLFAAGMAPSAAGLYHAGGILLFVAAVLLVTASGLLAPLPRSARAHKFVVAAFLWLIAAGALMALEPAHLARTGAGFSHAYTGAVRHALTVGFLSQMIIGVSLHLTPRFRPLSAQTGRAAAALGGVFALLNLGNAARVGLEIATDFTKAAFAPMGVTGFVELAALLLWAVHLAPWLLGKETTR